jgi:hypothetical protein
MLGKVFLVATGTSGDGITDNHDLRDRDVGRKHRSKPARACDVTVAVAIVVAIAIA